MKILLLESGVNRLNQQRTNLALARFSTFYKQLGCKVGHSIITHKGMLLPFVPDKVIACVIFSWDVPNILNSIKKIRKMNPAVLIEIGGVGTIRLASYIQEQVNISPFVGISPELDLIKPDPAFIAEDVSYVFTSRGCPGNCSFCNVSKFEGSCVMKIPNWKEQLDYTKKEWRIMDNNPLALPKEDRDNLLHHLRHYCSGAKIGRKIRVCSFDSGLDFRRIDEETIEQLKGIRFSDIKLAWDNVNYEQKFDEAMQLIQKIFPQKSSRGLYENVKVYVLYNYNDSIEDALYRVEKLYRHYKVFPYLMRYQPLDTLNYKTYLDPNWTQKDAVDVGRWCNNRRVFMNTPDYTEYVGRTTEGRSISNYTQYMTQVEEVSLFQEVG